MAKKIGFMQGRLSNLVNGKIQAFPWDSWQKEFGMAESLGLDLIEWTLDQERLYENPLMTVSGQRKIRKLCNQHNISIPSLTGDCFMQAPFWKSGGEDKTRLQADFLAIGEACAEIGIGILVVPLVDNGRLETTRQEDKLVEFLLEHQSFFDDHSLQLAFESDFAPAELARFIGRFSSANFGLNYDTGNSAAFGFNPVEELMAYGQRVLNIHIKDRIFDGPTVPLQTGAADFGAVFSVLSQQRYQGNFILQTARATSQNHDEVLANYRNMTKRWIKEYGILEKF